MTEPDVSRSTKLFGFMPATCLRAKPSDLTFCFEGSPGAQDGLLHEIVGKMHIMGQ